jgi:hypothetical protein
MTQMPTSDAAAGRSAEEWARAQLPLMSAADRIEAAVHAAGYRGLAGLELSVPDQEVRIYGQGAVPPGVSAEIDRLRSEGVAVVVLSAPHTREELHRLATALQEGPGHDAIVSISVPVDGSGLDVGVTDPTLSSALFAAQDEVGSVPLRLHVEEPQPPYRSDAAPVSAGARLAAFNGSSCGSSFAAWKYMFVSTVVLRKHYLLAAEHCGGGAGVDYFVSNGPAIGTGELVRADLDSVAVHTPIRSLPRMYDGGTGDDWFFRSVAALGTNRVGAFVNMSGVAGGTRSNLKIVETGKSVNQEGHWVTDLVVADQVDGQIAAIAGDSGSPVFGLDEHGRAIAMGSLYGPDKPLEPCPIPGVRCASSIRYVDLGAILRAHSLILTVAGDPLAWPPTVSMKRHPEHRYFYLRHRDLLGEISLVENDQDRQDATFWNMGPRTPGAGRTSFQSVNRPGYYLRQEFGRIKISAARSNQQFNDDATFIRRPGLAGQGDSFESVSFPGSFLHEEIRDLGRGPLGPLTRSELWISPPGTLAGDGGIQRTSLDAWNRSATYFTTPPVWQYQ